MKKKFIYFNVMETRDHSKNGAIPKSLMSKKTKQLNLPTYEKEF